MRTEPRSILIAALAPFLLAPGAATDAQAQRKFILQGATLINGTFERPLKNQLVIVEGGRITGVGRKASLIIPEGAVVIDVTGKFIIPGLIDAHAHEASMADWPRYLAWGITSVNCVYENSDTALQREAWSQVDTVRAPKIAAAAPVFTAKGGWREGEGIPSEADIDRFPSTPDEGRAAVRALNAKGLRRFELVADDMGWCRDPLPRLKKMDPAVMNAILDEAGKFHILTEVQAPAFADAAAAIAAGATGLADGVLDTPVDAPLVDAMLRGDRVYVPTFSFYHFLAGPDVFIARALSDSDFRRSLTPETIAALTSPGFGAGYKKLYPNAEYVASRLGTLDENLKSYVNNYALVALGSGLPELPGIGAHLELESMVKAGMTTMQAITAATFLSAKYLRILPKTGTLEPGKDADMLVLDADPAADIRNTRKISMVIKKGKIFRPADLLGAGGP